jgi:hypothetical protein
MILKFYKIRLQEVIQSAGSMPNEAEVTSLNLSHPFVWTC